MNKNNFSIKFNSIFFLLIFFINSNFINCIDSKLSEEMQKVFNEIEDEEKAFKEISDEIDSICGKHAEFFRNWLVKSARATAYASSEKFFDILRELAREKLDLIKSGKLDLVYLELKTLDNQLCNINKRFQDTNTVRKIIGLGKL